MQKRIAALEGNNWGGSSSKKCKAYNAGLSGDRETKVGKNSNSGHCPHCGKRHKGECCFKPSGTKDTSSSSNNNSQYKFNKPQQQYINELVEAAVKKTKDDSNVVESDEDDEWLG
jgi:hypothetical protein